MLISILVPDISSNILWAATAMGRALQSRFDVEVIGPDLGRGICGMYRQTFSYKAIPAKRLYRWPDYIWESKRLANEVKGDVIVAVKAYADTLPIALRLKRSRGAKVIVYLDEWDSADYAGLSMKNKALMWMRHAHHPLEDLYFPFVERLIPRADAVLCSSTFLARRFHATICPLGVDTDLYAPPSSKAVDEMKKLVGLPEARWISFGGVVRPHKGVEDILNALAILNDTSIRLLVVGPTTEYLAHLQRTARYRPFIMCLGERPKEDMPKYLALGDLVVLSQHNTPLAQSQVPCKVFEAMAMGKPIIATTVSDLPQILDGCGWLVPPDDPSSLAHAIEYACSHPDEGRKMGEQARARCLQEYDQSVTAEKLVGLVEKVIEG